MTQSQQPLTAVPEVRGAGATPSGFGARWAAAICLYDLYAALAREFSLGAPPSAGLAAADQPAAEALSRVERWLEEMDDRLQVQQLRQYLQTCHKVTEESLRVLAYRHLHRPQKKAADRDKVDFLLVQYFALCAPENIFSQPVELADVAEVLKPILGTVDCCPLDWLVPLDGILKAIEQCRCLQDLLTAEYLEQGRRVKESAGNMSYDPSALVAYCRFNFLLRRALIRLMQADLRAIRAALSEMDTHGISDVDCRSAGLSAAEPVVSLQALCEAWKQPFRMNKTEYSLGPTFERLVNLRAAVEDALGRLGPRSAAGEPIKGSAAGRAAPPSQAVKAMTPPAHSTAAEARNSSPTAKPDASGPQVMNPVPAPPSAAEIEDFSEAIWEQLIEAPPGRGRSMATVVVRETRIVLYSWEVAAFVSDSGPLSNDIRQAVATRGLLVVALESAKRSGDAAALKVVLPWARQEIAGLQERVEQAKSAKNTELAVNLGISAKRLRAFIEQAEALPA